jgi:hypothetical protein
MNITDFNEYPYPNIAEFLQDEEKIQQIAKGSSEGHDEDWKEFFESYDFETDVLDCIKAYSGQGGIGYPPTPEEDIEEAFTEYEIVDYMREYLLSYME